MKTSLPISLWRLSGGGSVGLHRLGLLSGLLRFRRVAPAGLLRHLLLGLGVVALVIVTRSAANFVGIDALDVVPRSQSKSSRRHLLEQRVRFPDLAVKCRRDGILGCFAALRYETFKGQS